MSERILFKGRTLEAAPNQHERMICEPCWNGGHERCYSGGCDCLCHHVGSKSRAPRDKSPEPDVLPFTGSLKV